jgi:MOSC domain-containing protein YiiM
VRSESSLWARRYGWVAQICRGDAQADLEHHGGPDKAVLTYSAEHYPKWRRELQLPNLPYGAFGENFTVAGLDEERVAIGDIYSLGDARVQVSQPRSPCWKISHRWKIKDLTARVEATGRLGWYLRVLNAGYIERGLPLILVDRPLPQWTVAVTFKIMHHRKDDYRAAAELAACPLLSANWRKQFSDRSANIRNAPSRRESF